MLFIAIRKVFKGEEITINYMLGKADKDEPMTCAAHACYCGSRFCSGSMHDAEETFAAWEQFLKKQSGSAYTKLPSPYGTPMPELESYPMMIREDFPTIHDLFGSERKQPLAYADAALPSLLELRKRIRETGRSLKFPKFHMTILGIKKNFLFAERTP
jgi:hypothetical protein